MERNSDDLPNTSRDAGASGAGSTGGTGGYADSGYGASGGGYANSGDVSGTAGYNVGSGAGTSGSIGGSDQGLADRASGAVDTAREKLADAGSTVRDRAADIGSTVRERAGTAKNSLADMLTTGAEKLRNRTHGDGLAAVGAAGATTTVAADDRMTQVSDRVAGGMQAAGDWLRDADLDSMRVGVERQVKEHPGRTLLVALGLGYLLGKAFRK